MTEPFDPGQVSYLDQESGNEWSKTDTPFAYFASDEWFPLPDSFTHEAIPITQSSSPTTQPAVPTSPSASYAVTEPQHDIVSSIEEEAATNASDLDTHDAASDIISTIFSTAQEEQPPAASHNDIQRPASYGKVSMIVKSSRRSPLKCKWKHCEYSGGFSQMGALLRHIKTKHIAPDLFGCPEGECPRSFNRKDNLVAHLRNVHRTNV